ncbi:homeodomain transcription factor [Mycena latifolia]|nr:homeodomain transcription factor [Mycena latifolia]
MPPTIPQFTSSDHLYALATSDAASTRTRKRFSNAQVVVLEQLFHKSPHPTLEERELFAKYVGMEVKSVTVWFQNKRQSERKATSRRTHNTTHTTTTHPYPKLSTANSRASSTSTSASRRPSLNLDQVASRSEKPVPTPRTPSRRHNPHAPLWANMASSPIGPPSSPASRDFVEFAQGQRTRTLEWACARRRLTGKEEGTGVPRLLEDTDGDTDVEVDEAVTPPSSCDSSWTGSIGGTPTIFKAGEPDDDTMHAALALCGMRAYARVDAE